LRYEKSLCRLCRLPDISVSLAAQSFDAHIVHVMTERSEHWEQRLRQILVQLDLHAAAGMGGTGMSSSADTAAKATTARNASAVTVGKSARISSADAPSAKLASNVRTVTRVPLMTSVVSHKRLELLFCMFQLEITQNSRTSEVEYLQPIARHYTRLDSVEDEKKNI